MRASRQRLASAAAWRQQTVWRIHHGRRAAAAEKHCLPMEDALMKAYLMTTGAVFGLVTLAHLWRLYEEGPNLAADPWFLLLTAAAGALSLWAWRLLRIAARS
jgi:hypothetical protein